jgi:hypothetical protein
VCQNLHSTGSRHHRLARIKSVSYEKDRDADLQGVHFAFAIEDTDVGTALVRRSTAKPSTDRVDGIILEALASSRHGLDRSEIVKAVEIGRGLRRSTAQTHIASLKQEGKIAEAVPDTLGRSTVRTQSQRAGNQMKTLEFD